jgi:hypothetical protein
MRINEVTKVPQTYIATVRVDLRGRSATARTTVTADTFQQAQLILTRIFGEGSVLSVNQSMQESPRTDQIQRRATFRDQTAQTSRRQPTRGPNLISQVSETDSAPKPPDPSKQRIKSLNDQATRLKQQAQQMKAQDAVKKAQAQVATAVTKSRTA